MQANKHISQQALVENHFNGGGYAFCRLPGATVYHYMAQADRPQHIQNLHDCCGKSGYVVAPFHSPSSMPALLIAPDLHETCEIPLDIQNYSIKTTITDNGRKQYANAFSHCHHLLTTGVCEKIVLARSMQLTAEAAPHPVSLFLNACLAHPNHYVALWWTAETGLWLVATPEVLLESDGHHWHTMALAGTEAWNNGTAVADIERWSHKNRREQQLVADEVAKCLRPYVQELEASPTYPCRAGSVVHLRTDFRFALNPTATPYNIIEDLHPTPAVCGVPRHKALEAILEAEAEPRRYYAGYSGMLTPEGQTHFYVSLRCLSIHEKAITLYAGGGLLSSSVEIEEWEETERKLQTMLQVLNPKA